MAKLYDKLTNAIKMSSYGVIMSSNMSFILDKVDLLIKNCKFSEAQSLADTIKNYKFSFECSFSAFILLSTKIGYRVSYSRNQLIFDFVDIFNAYSCEKSMLLDNISCLLFSLDVAPRMWIVFNRCKRNLHDKYLRKICLFLRKIVFY